MSKILIKKDAFKAASAQAIAKLEPLTEIIINSPREKKESKEKISLIISYDKPDNVIKK